MKELYLAIDQGTTSSRVIIFDLTGRQYAQAQKEFKQFYPNDGWVEHDGSQIWEDVLTLCQDALSQLEAPEQVRAIGITNQRETVLLWDKKTGKPLAPAIVWQDRRTASYCRSLRAEGHEAMIREKTGLLLDPYFSASKIRWLLQEHKILETHQPEDVAFGTMETWLIWNLTKGKSHVTDISNASRTLLCNIQTQQWDEELLKLFEIPVEILPEIVENVGAFGAVASGLLPVDLKITGCAGDQQSAMVGQSCFSSGMMKATYGTGCFALLNTGEKAVRSQHRLLTTIAWKVHGQVCYALEGAIFNAGTAIQWLRDELKIIETAGETEERAQIPEDSHGVTFIPAFTGLGAPYWEPDVRGAIFGLTRNSTDNHIIRAALEAICFQTKDLMEAMLADCTDDLFEEHILRVDGGMVKNNWLLQFLADSVQMPVDRPEVTETTAFGAACLAAVGCGDIATLEELAEYWRRNARFDPIMSAEDVDQKYRVWRQNIKRLISADDD